MVFIIWEEAQRCVNSKPHIIMPSVIILVITPHPQTDRKWFVSTGSKFIDWKILRKKKKQREKSDQHLITAVLYRKSGKKGSPVRSQDHHVIRIKECTALLFLKKTHRKEFYNFSGVYNNINFWFGNKWEGILPTKTELSCTHWGSSSVNNQQYQAFSCLLFLNNMSRAGIHFFYLNEMLYLNTMYSSTCLDWSIWSVVSTTPTTPSPATATPCNDTHLQV